MVEVVGTGSRSIGDHGAPVAICSAEDLRLPRVSCYMKASDVRDGSLDAIAGRMSPLGRTVDALRGCGDSKSFGHVEH